MFAPQVSKRDRSVQGPTADRLELAEALIESLDDDLDEDERQRLHAALDEAQADIEAGRTRPAAEVLADLRRDL
jgi:hypothetical protein